MSLILLETVTLLAGLISLCVFVRLYQSKTPYGSTSPANTPYLSPWVPFVGSIGYALDPQIWMERMHKKMGDVFTTTILGQNVTFVSGHKNVVKWAGASNKELDLSEAYKKITSNLVGPEVFEIGLTKSMYDALASNRLDKLQDDLFAFTMQFVERKLGSSTTWSEPTDITPLLVEGTMQLGAWTMCGRHLAETCGTELAENFHVLGNDLSIIGMALNFPTPAVRRRNKAKKRTFEIIEQEFRERVRAIQEGKVIDDDFMSAVLVECLDDETMASGDEEEIMKVIKKTIYLIYGLIWASHTNTGSAAVATFCDLLMNPEHIDLILSQCGFKTEASPGFIILEQTHLLRCLTETFRRHVTGTLIRLASDPFTISDAQSPSGAIIAPPGFLLVAPSPYSLSPEIYPSPLAFNPNRYDPSVFPYELDIVQSPSVSANAGLFASWGFGKHACPGRFLAYSMVGNLVLAMLGGWEIEMVGEAPSWKGLASGGMERAQGPLMIRWRKRQTA